MNVVSNRSEDSLVEPNTSLDDPFIIAFVVYPLKMSPLPWKDHYAKDIVPDNHEDSKCPCKVHKCRTCAHKYVYLSSTIGRIVLNALEN